MKKTRFQRTTALLLTFAMLVGGAVTASAAGSNSSVTDSTIASMKDLLGTISYEEYCSKHYKKDKASVVYFSVTELLYTLVMVRYLASVKSTSLLILKIRWIAVFLASTG